MTDPPDPGFWATPAAYLMELAEDDPDRTLHALALPNLQAVWLVLQPLLRSYATLDGPRLKVRVWEAATARWVLLDGRPIAEPTSGWVAAEVKVHVGSATF